MPWPGLGAAYAVPATAAAVVTAACELAAAAVVAAVVDDSQDAVVECVVGCSQDASVPDGESCSCWLPSGKHCCQQLLLQAAASAVARAEVSSWFLELGLAVSLQCSPMQPETDIRLF